MAISEHDADLMFDQFAREYHTKPPGEFCGIFAQFYSFGTVTLVLEPGPYLTWGMLAKSMFAFPLFMDWFGYVGLKYEIRDLGANVYASGYIIGGVA